MKRSRFSESQIIRILKKAEADVSLAGRCRTYGFSKSSFYKWDTRRCAPHTGYCSHFTFPNIRSTIFAVLLTHTPYRNAK